MGGDFRRTAYLRQGGVVMAEVLALAVAVALLGFRWWLGLKVARHFDELPPEERAQWIQRLGRSAY